MNKSSKITLIVITVIFIGLTVWRVVDWSVRQREQSKQQVVSVQLVGPALVKAGEFDENLYKMNVNRVSGNVDELSFRALYFDDESYRMLYKEGAHTLKFTFEQCEGTFDITIVGNAEMPKADTTAGQNFAFIIISAVILLAVVAVLVIVIVRAVKRKRA